MRMCVEKDAKGGLDHGGTQKARARMRGGWFRYRSSRALAYLGKAPLVGWLGVVRVTESLVGWRQCTTFFVSLQVAPVNFTTLGIQNFETRGGRRQKTGAFFKRSDSCGAKSCVGPA